MVTERLEGEAELAAAKLQMQRREESAAAAQRARQREMNLRLIGQFGAVVVTALVIAYVYFF